MHEDGNFCGIVIRLVLRAVQIWTRMSQSHSSTSTIMMNSTRRYDDPRSTSEETEAAGASDSTTSGTNMFSSYSCFTGGSYYHVRGDAHFSPLFQVSSGKPNL